MLREVRQYTNPSFPDEINYLWGQEHTAKIELLKEYFLEVYRVHEMVTEEQLEGHDPAFGFQAAAYGQKKRQEVKLRKVPLKGYWA